MGYMNRQKKESPNMEIEYWKLCNPKTRERKEWRKVKASEKCGILLRTSIYV